MKSLTDWVALRNAEKALRQTIRTNFHEWVAYILKPRGQHAAAHHLEIIKHLEALDRGDISRLMLLLPPGSAKSTFASILFPAWWFARNPSKSLIMCCHTAALADHFGRGVRTLLTDHAARLNVFVRPDSRAVARFLTEQGGEYFGVGIGGAVTGRRADLAVIDDPIRSFADAESAAARERLWNWYRSELVTRLKPGARVLLVMTRWHCDDIAARLMGQGSWQCLCLPALAEANDPLGRNPGDALWPSWESREEVLAKRATLGERGFNALYQQAPTPAGGALFDASRLQFADHVPAGSAVRAWDLAGTSDPSHDPDWTVGVRLVRDAKGAFWVDDVVRMRANPADVESAILGAAAQDGETTTIGLPRDPGQAGSYQVMMLTRTLAGYRVRNSPERGSKLERAQAVASQVSAGNVFIRRASWNRVFIDEVSEFPNGRKDDQVDALSRAFGMLAHSVAPAHFTSVQFFAR